MGLKEIAAKAAEAAFKAMDDLAADVVYRRLIDFDNPDWENEASWEEYQMKGVISDQGEAEEYHKAVCRDFVSNTRRMMLTVLKSSFPFEPSMYDKVSVNGKYGNIDQILKGSAGAIIEMEIALWNEYDD